MLATTCPDANVSLSRQPNLSDSIADWMRDQEGDSRRSGAQAVLADLQARAGRARTRVANARAILAAMSSPWDREWHHIWQERIAADEAVLARLAPEITHWTRRVEG